MNWEAGGNALTIGLSGDTEGALFLAFLVILATPKGC